VFSPSIPYLTMHVSSLAIYLSTIALAVGLLNERAISLAKELQSPNFIPYTPENTADRGKRDVQEPLLLQKDVATLSKHHTARLDIHSDSFLGLIPFYWTNIALGTPNQAFRMIIDLSYAGAVVRAPNCTDPFPGCDAGFIYYHNQSSTYRPEYEHFSIPLPGHTLAGTVSTDHMQLIDLNITDVTFGEVDDIHGENWLIMSMTAHADGYANTVLLLVIWRTAHTNFGSVLLDLCLPMPQCPCTRTRNCPTCFKKSSHRTF
jgi:hypothetical protein